MNLVPQLTQWNICHKWIISQKVKGKPTFHRKIKKEYLPGFGETIVFKTRQKAAIETLPQRGHTDVQ